MYMGTYICEFLGGKYISTYIYAYLVDSKDVYMPTCVRRREVCGSIVSIEVCVRLAPVGEKRS